jgi:signal peptidase II
VGTLLTRTVTPLLLACVLVGTVGCDRVTKRLAVETLAGSPDRTFLGGTVRILYAENTGGFLSLGAGLSPGLRRAVFVGATGLLLVLVLATVVRHRRGAASLLGATLFLAGGASNWIDRVAHGKVIDFLNVGVGPVRTGVFNVADVAIVAGLALLLTIEFAPRRPAG